MQGTAVSGAGFDEGHPALAALGRPVEGQGGLQVPPTGGALLGLDGLGGEGAAGILDGKASLALQTPAGVIGALCSRQDEGWRATGGSGETGEPERVEQVESNRTTRTTTAMRSQGAQDWRTGA